MPKSSVVRVLLGGALLLLVMLAIFAPAAAPVPTLRRSGDAEPDRNLELYLAERGSAQNGESESLMAIANRVAADPERQSFHVVGTTTAAEQWLFELLQLWPGGRPHQRHGD